MSDWQIVVSDRFGTRRFTRDIPDDILREFNALKDGKFEFLSRLLADDRIVGHVLTICEPGFHRP